MRESLTSAPESPSEVTFRETGFRSRSGSGMTRLPYEARARNHGESDPHRLLISVHPRSPVPPPRAAARPAVAAVEPAGAAGVPGAASGAGRAAVGDVDGLRRRRR